MPVLRDIGNALKRSSPTVKEVTGGSRPVLDALNWIAKTVQKDADAAIAERPFDSDLFFDNMEMTGYILGLPTAQPRITLEVSLRRAHG